jgi:hypothetical protein
MNSKIKDKVIFVYKSYLKDAWRIWNENKLK